MRLPPADIGTLVGAMERGFSIFELERLASERLGSSIDQMSSRVKPIGSICSDIALHFDRRNTAEHLIAALRDARPTEGIFVKLADTAGFALVPDRSAFEILIRNTPFRDVGAFRTDLAAKEAAVCLVDTETGTGSGVLIGPDLVVTNHHVVEDLLDSSGRLTGTATCLFDHVRSSDGYETPGVRVGVAAVLASSPLAPEDGDADTESADDSKLDYALLRLERTIGSEPIVEGFAPRGFVAPTSRVRSLAVDEGVIVLQHPDGRPMKIDIGSVTRIGPTRIRHTVNTEPGSSGSPVFDAELNLVGIHHVGVGSSHTPLPYNQAIPIGLIVADARRRGATL